MRQPKPFKKKRPGGYFDYFVQIGKRQIPLGRDRDEAYRQYHELMAGRQPVTNETTCATLFDQFLAWTERNRSRRTYEWYTGHLQSFLDHVGALKVGDTRAHHITRWLDECYSSFGENYQNGAVRAIKRAFNWSVKQELIERNPAATVETPPYCPRETWITPEQWKQVLSFVKAADPFHDMLVFLYRSGCRPFEARIAESRHFDKGEGCLVYRLKDSKGKRYRRVIPLEGDALAIIQRLALKHPDGNLFRNSKGRPWSSSALDHRFATLTDKVGFKVFPYQLRHSWATDALKSGVQPTTVATVLGHRSLTMIYKVYGHLIQDTKFLQSEIGKINRARA